VAQWVKAVKHLAAVLWRIWRAVAISPQWFFGMKSGNFPGLAQYRFAPGVGFAKA
jgi:hypothetical protein